MEAGEITRRNVAIVEYMDGETSPDYPDAVLVRKGRYLRAEWSCDLKYHNDWSWLMPVVERIAKSWDSKILIGIYHDSPLNFPRALWDAIWLISNKDKPLIESVWLAVSDHILSLEK